MQIEKRLEELGITLPPAATPVANYVTTRPNGEFGVYVGARSGHWRGQDL